MKSIMECKNENAKILNRLDKLYLTGHQIPSIQAKQIERHKIGLAKLLDLPYEK